MYLTVAQRTSVQAELDSVLRELRDAAVAVVEAREQTGNQAENATAEVALDEQRRLVDRATHLTAMLAAAGVSPAPDGSRVEPGTRVCVAYPDGDSDTFLFGTAVGTEEDVITPASPLGRSLLGCEPGQHATFTTPNGRTVTVTVLSVQVA